VCLLEWEYKVILWQEAGGRHLQETQSVILKEEAGGVILGTNEVRTPESNTDPGQARMTKKNY